MKHVLGNVFGVGGYTKRRNRHHRARHYQHPECGLAKSLQRTVMRRRHGFAKNQVKDHPIRHEADNHDCA